MFKSASIFKVKLPQPMLVSILGDAAKVDEFIPCGATQERSIGWVPPRGQEHGAMVENIGGQLILRLAIETKSVPAQVLRDAVDAKAKQIEVSTGRKPGKKEKRELSDDIRLSMLPMAFSNRSATWVWINPETGTMVIDSASQQRLDDVVTQVVKLIDGIVVQRLNTNVSPASLMTSWLHDGDQLSTDDRFGFSMGRMCELKACDETKAKVRYQNHMLEIQQVRDHVKTGKSATKLALTWSDRVSFVLDDAGRLTAIKFLEVVFENAAQRDSGVDAFDADVTIVTAELEALISGLVDAHGGEIAQEGGAA